MLLHVTQCNIPGGEKIQIISVQKMLLHKREIPSSWNDQRSFHEREFKINESSTPLKMIEKNNEVSQKGIEERNQ